MAQLVNKFYDISETLENETYNGAWQDVSGCCDLIGTIRATVTCNINFDWSWDGGTTTEYTSADQEITGGTPAITNEVAVIAPYARMNVVATTSTVVVAYFGGRDY